METMRKNALLISTLPLLTVCILAEEPTIKPSPSVDPAAPQLLRRSYSSTALGASRDYYVVLPAGYGLDGEHRWPVLLFLHGDGERGNARDELDYLMVNGPLYEAWIQKRDLPFIIVAPQLPMYGRDKTVPYLENRNPIPERLAEGVPPRPSEFPTPEKMTGATPDPAIPVGPTGPPDGWNLLEADLLQILDDVLGKLRADPRRVYLTGLSYGGFGAWYLASRHPERFAAVCSVVAWGHPDLMPPLAERQMPIWVFAGGRDPVVPVKHFYPGLNRLESLGHENLRFTVHEDMGHDVWARVFGGRDVYDWLLSHRQGD